MEMSEKDNAKKELKGLPLVQQSNVGRIAYLNFMEKKGWSVQAKFIWLHLDMRSGLNRYFWANKESIAVTLGFSEDTYNKYLAEVEEFGGVVRFKRYSKIDGRRGTDIILVCEYDQINEKFLLPRNYTDIAVAIETKWSKEYKITFPSINEYLTKSFDSPKPKKSVKVKKEPKPKNSDKGNNTPKPKISDKTKPKISVKATPESVDIPQEPKPKISDAEYIESILNKDKSMNKEKEDTVPPINSIQNTLDTFYQSMQSELSEVSFITWIEPLLIHITNQEAIIEAKDKFNYDIIEKRYLDLIEKKFSAIGIFKVILKEKND